MNLRTIVILAAATSLAACEPDSPEFPNNAPLVSAGDDMPAETGDTVVLDGSGTRDLDGDVLSYRWTLVAKPDGSRATLSRTDVPQPSFFVDLAGNYRARLTVSDGRGESVEDEVTFTATLSPTAVCRITPPLLDFGTVPPGSRLTRSVVVENLGAATLSGGASLGGCPGYSLGPTDLYNLATGETATIEITFLPTVEATFDCTLLLGNCEDVFLTGVGGSGPNCELTIGSPDLGAAILDDTPVTTTVEVANIGTGTLTGTLQLDAGNDWSFVGSPSYSVGAGQTQTITLQFAPTSVGYQNAIVESGSDDCSTTVETGAIGLLSLDPYCSVTPEIIDFGDVNFREFPGIEVTVTNLGGGTLSSTITWDCEIDFWIEDGTSFDLLTNEQHTFTVRFLPSRTGLYECELDFNQESCDPVTIRANGVDPMTPECVLSATELDFGGVNVGEIAVLPISVRNNFTGVLSGTPTLNDPDGVFDILSGGEPLDLLADESRNLEISFAPTLAVTSNATLSLGPDCPEIPIVGTGGIPPACDLSVPSMALGNLTVGDIVDFTITVTNSGGGTLSGSVGSTCSFLSVLSSNTYSLMGGESQDIDFRFRPTSRGAVNCSISFGSNCAAVPVTASVAGRSFATDVQTRLNGSCSGCHGTFTYANTVPSRVNVADPPNSNLLRYPSCQVSHSCRSGWAIGDTNYNITLEWIEQGAFNN